VREGAGCVTRAEKATLKAAAKRAGQDMSVWLRTVGLEAAERSVSAEK
jgi:hypothetical protein